MSRTNAFELTINPAGIEALAGKIAMFDADRLGDIARTVVNDVTARFDTSARKAMNAGIALDDAYISSRMTTVLATSAVNPVATITAQGPRAGLTILGHYNPVVTYRAAPGARGDAKRGVPANNRAAGVRVEVSRGKPKVIPGAFTMTLRRGAVGGDQVGVFIRELGKVRHLYAVAPYSLFRHQVELGLEALDDDLAATAGDVIATEYGKVFS